MGIKYNALVIRHDKKVNEFISEVEILDTDFLPTNDLLIKVQFSSLNYKDILSVQGNPGVTRKFPHTPGIDAAGIIVKSNVQEFKEGEEVFVVGQLMGMTCPGGFGQYISVPKNWVSRKPTNLTLKQTMIYGTAGLTAALAVKELLNQNIKPNTGPIIVSGATGGVGSLTVAILSKLGFEVHASTNKFNSHEFLKNLGALQILNREELNNSSEMPQLKERWSGGIDTVGGGTLSTIIRSCKKYGTVMTIGNIESQFLNVSLMPFILRGVRLIGVNSQELSQGDKKLLWEKLGDEWKPDCLNSIASEFKLEEINDNINSAINGLIVGRKVLIY